MYTHCGVNNFALSVSEAIAKPQRSRIIWTLAIVIHAPIKLYYSFELTKFYVDYLYSRVNMIIKLPLRMMRVRIIPVSVLIPDHTTSITNNKY